LSEARERVVDSYQRNDQNVSAVARELGLTRPTVIEHLRNAGIKRPIVGGQAHATGREKRDLPAKGVKRYILTSAQNNTRVWQPFWRNLMAAVDYFDAELLVGSFTYNTNAYSKLSVKRGSKDSQKTLTELSYAKEVDPYLDASDRDIELAPGLVWCGRLNILPTAVHPLTGFETYTGTSSSIIPHAKIAERSVPQARDQGAKFLYTTGTVTQQNYIQKTAGQKAEFHHAYGALLVEVESDGTWYARQLNSDKTGRFYDVDACFDKGEVTEGHRVEAVSWGDIHRDLIDENVRHMAWGDHAESMVNELEPTFQFFHDILDFRGRNHHERDDPHLRFKRFIQNRENVREECQRVVEFLDESQRGFCQSVVVDSNHDAALGRWLREADYRKDPVNAVFFLKLQAAVYESIEQSNGNFHLMEYAMRLLGTGDDIRFLRTDESFVIGKNIECGMHGHLGPNGSRGTPANLSKLGLKANVGHTHSAGIYDGLYVAGLCGKLDQGYNKGPSSWSTTQIVTYQNGKRALYTMSHRDWRARD
jgi:hypothetical protein